MGNPDLMSRRDALVGVSGRHPDVDDHRIRTGQLDLTI